jgi:hypothetical protein
MRHGGFKTFFTLLDGMGPYRAFAQGFIHIRASVCRSFGHAQPIYVN